MELNIPHRSSAHCENGAISALLRYHNIDLSEPMIFGLASGIFFSHIPFVKVSGMSLTSFRTYPGVLFKRITKQLGIKTKTKRFFSTKRAMERLDNLILKEKKPVGCVVGMYYLPYAPIEYRFHFNGHNICIIGKDVENQEYSVLDSNVIGKVSINREDLIKIRFAKGGTYPLMGQMYWIESVPKELPNLTPLIFRSILKSCRSMIPRVKWGHYSGVSGIFYLAKRIMSWESKYGERGAKLELAQIIRMLEEIGTGGAGFRFIYGAFLQEVSKITGLVRYNEFSKKITEIGDLWRFFAYTGSRIIKKRKGENYTFEDLSKLLIEIANEEKSFFTSLKKYTLKEIENER